MFASKFDYKINKKGSCYSILMNDLSIWSGMYTINPNWWNQYFDVYCDMSSDWWGWTLLATAIWEDTSIYDYDDIVNWNSTNSDNCWIDTECLSESWDYLDKWDELLVYTRWYKVKWIRCNDIWKTIYDYSALPNPNRITSSNWWVEWYWAVGKCDEEYEVSQWLEVSDKTTNSDQSWTTRMWVKTSWNETWEHSLLFFWPVYIPQWLWNARYPYKTWKIDNHYDSDTSSQHNLWDWASTEKQVWFIR